MDPEYPPRNLQRLREAPAKDPPCLAIMKEMDSNVTTRYQETAERVLVRVALLDKAVQVYEPQDLREVVLTLEHDPAHAGNHGVNKMYVSMERAFYWEAMIADVGI